MKKEICEYIKKCVYENIAPIHYGKVSLSEVYRLFSNYGSLSDLENCLDDFIKNGIAEKKMNSKGKIYIFKNIALEYGKRLKKELNNLKNKEEKIKKEISYIKNNIGIIEEIGNIWKEKWEKYFKNKTYASLINYISIFLGNYMKKYLDLLQDYNNKLKEIEGKIEEIQSILEESYEVINNE